MGKYTPTNAPHAANSPAAIGIPESRFDMVRVGLALYGICPAEHLRCRIDLKPALTLRSRIVQVKKVRAGTTISYGRTHLVKKDTVIAVVT